MVLTLKAHRRRTLKKSRRISTIPVGRTDVGPANVSAVDTGPRRSESPGFLRHGPVPPSQVRPHRPLPVACAGGRRLWLDAGPAQSWPESARVGLLNEGRDPLAKGCAYCTKAPPTRSAPNPRAVTPIRRAVHPDDAVSHHSDRVSLIRQGESAALPSGRHTHRCLEMS